MSKRRNQVLGAMAILLGAGLGYAWLCTHTSLRLVCLFTKITGLACPGCGVTRMCLALLRLDFAAAWRANAGVLLCLPVMAVIGARMLWRYVQSGKRTSTAWEQRALWLLVISLLFWGFLRNFL